MTNSLTVLTTGSTSGIGLAFTHLFAKEGYSLVLVSRDEAQLRTQQKDLQEKYGISVTIIPKDLSKNAAASEVFAMLRDQHIIIDILINNAGFATYGWFKELPAEKEEAEMILNMVTVTLMTKYFLQQPGLSRGRILNVASTAAFQPGPTMAVYYATKSYVLSFSESIAEELRDTNITVTALCPGATHTGFSKEAHLERSRLFQSRHVMDAETVAKIGFNGLMKGKRIVIPGLRNTILSFLPRITPRSVTTRFVKRLQSEKS